MELDYTHLPKDEVALRVSALATFLSAHPGIQPTISVDAEVIKLFAQALTPNNIPGEQEGVTAKIERFDENEVTNCDIKKDPGDSAPADTADTDGIEPVKRRSKAEIAAGMSALQAARYRKYGDRAPALWLQHIGELPDEPCEPDAEEPAAEEPAAEEPAAEEPAAEEPAAEEPAADDKPDTSDIEPIEYAELQATVFELVKNDMKAQAKQVAEDVFGVKTFTQLTDPVDFARAKIILDDIAENGGEMPDQKRLDALLNR